MKKKLISVLITGLVFLTPVRSQGQLNTDFKSKVPKFTFSNTVSEQEEELKSNPLVLRMAESRKKLSHDKWRPIYHYVNPEGNLNDPNGLCFWQGNWHLFYQGYPPEDPRQHWGHAISKDLIHWKDLPYAIYPDPERAVYSGSTYVDNDKVIAMYHGTLAGNMVAVSSDPLLLNWEKVSGKAVIPLNSTTGFTLPYSVFDPCIWKKDSVYYSLSAGRTNTGPGGKPVRESYLFRSLDLEHWEYVHEFVENDRFTLIGDDGACPYFWPIGNKYIMNFFSHKSGGQYLIGDYDKARDKFVVTSGGKYNHGAVGPAGVHAPSATPDGKGGVIILFNMNPGRTTQGWNQIMSLPRRLTLLPNSVLGQGPAGDINSLRYDPKHLCPTTLPANKEIVLQSIKGNSMEIDAEIDLAKAQMFEINVLRSPGKEEYTKIVFYKDKGFGSGLEYTAGPGTALMPSDLVTKLTGKQDSPRDRTTMSLISIQSEYSSSLPDTRFRPPETAAFRLEQGEIVKLRIFIDRSIIEVFVNGKECVAMRVYPDRKDSIGVSVRAHGETAELKSLDAWQMKSIYE
ncbi:MAG TPA: glycoside hydrolase family 32 protein [Bacteroidales bacterium]|nr:glycoside hydrolase family 32 protein [Bacteroidales bacterium]